MTKLAMFAAATLLAAAPAVAPASPGDEAEAGYLGVRLQRIEGGLAEALDLKADSGVLVSQVEKDSPAEKAGLKSGDILTKFDGKAVATPADLRTAVRGAKSGQKVKVSYLRDGKAGSVDVELSAAPDSRPGRMRWLSRMNDDDDAHQPRRDRMRDHMREIREMRLGKERGYLGVQTQPLTGDLAEYFGAGDGGALVAEVVDDSPAAKLGLKAGDVITKVDDESIEDPADLRRTIGGHEEPSEVQLTWVRDKKVRTGKVELETREGMAFLGPDGPGMPEMDRFDWVPGDGGDGMRQRVHAFRMRADEGAQQAIDELREQVQKLQEQVKKLEKSK